MNNLSINRNEHKVWPIISEEEITKSFNEQTKVLYGMATVSSHHGEIMQGSFAADENSKEYLPSLITMPCNLFYTKVIYRVADTREINVYPQWKNKAENAARITLDFFKHENIGGEISIITNTPVGKGFGSSTMDVTATILAICNALGIIVSNETIAQLTVAAEIASDPLAYWQQPVLFAQRGGIVLEKFSSNLPAIRVLGFDTDQDDKQVDTITRKIPNYSIDELETYELLRSLFRRALIEKSPHLLGIICSESAKINNRYYPIKNFDAIRDICNEIGAEGVQISHSGTIMGMIFDSSTELVSKKIANAISLLKEIGIDSHWIFNC